MAGAEHPSPRDLDVGVLLEQTRDPREVLVVVPVYNGGAAVAGCLDSVVRYSGGARVVVIDDASTDAGVVGDLVARSACGEIELIRHAENWGYTRTANQALHLSDTADVVLLNSDTEVGPLWLVWLRAVAAGNRGVATVSAVSDNAGAFALPEAGIANAWPAHLTWSQISRGVARTDLPSAVEAPTGHGFCMLITRAAIETVGGFDEARFPRGYGEENDFCMRARACGMVNLVAPHAFVRHLRSQSFGAERSGLVERARRIIDELHPTYSAEVRAWLAGRVMADLRARFGALRAELGRTESVRPRRLYVLHRSGGGTPATNLDLMGALTAEQDSYVLESVGGEALELRRITESGGELCLTWRPERPFRVTDGWRQDYALVVAGIILGLGVELVHIRHLITHPLTTLPEVCRRLGVPFVLSTHDFYMACPTIHLLDEDDRFCGATCTAGGGECALPVDFVRTVPPLKHRWVHEWRRRAGSVLTAANAVVSTTESAASILCEAYPALRDSIKVIEHGRDLEASFAPLRSGARRQGPLRIAAVAHWAPHKGLRYLAEVARAVGPEVEWHILGARSELLAEIGTPYGAFEREAQRGVMIDIDPDFAAIFSIWPETYAHTLSEAWAFGLPVLATDIGAVAERIRTHGGGLLLPLGDAGEAARQIKELVADPSAVAAARASVPRSGTRTRTQMAENYLELYDRVESGYHWVGAAAVPGFSGDGSRV